MSARATLVRNISDATLLTGIYRTRGGRPTRPAVRPSHLWAVARWVDIHMAGNFCQSGKGRVADDPLGMRRQPVGDCIRNRAPLRLGSKPNDVQSLERSR
jgi:hypothetical protein